MALVDTWVTHNFISTSEIAKLGLKLLKDDSKLKGVKDFLSVPLCNFNFILVTASFRGPR